MMTWEQALTLMRIVIETSAVQDPRFKRFHDEAAKRLSDVADVTELIFADDAVEPQPEDE